MNTLTNNNHFEQRVSSSLLYLRILPDFPGLFTDWHTIPLPCNGKKAKHAFGLLGLKDCMLVQSCSDSSNQTWFKFHGCSKILVVPLIMVHIYNSWAWKPTIKRELSCSTCQKSFKKTVKLLREYIKDLTSEGIEPNPGPDELWKIQNMCVDFQITYSAEFLALGPAHNRHFKCFLSIDGTQMAVADGGSKKEAEFNAAVVLYPLFLELPKVENILTRLKELQYIQRQLKRAGIRKNCWVKDLTEECIESNPGPRKFLRLWWHHRWALCTECSQCVSLSEPNICHPGFSACYIATPDMDLDPDEALCEFICDIIYKEFRFLAHSEGKVGRMGALDFDVWHMEHPGEEYYYQWLPDEMRVNIFDARTFVLCCLSAKLERRGSSESGLILWDEGMFHARRHSVAYRDDADVHIVNYRLKGVAAHSPGTLLSLFRAYNVDYDSVAHRAVRPVLSSLSLHAIAQLQITEANRVCKNKYGMNLRQLMTSIYEHHRPEDLTADGDVESNPGPWSELWHTFRYVCAKMKKAGYADFDERTRAFLIIFKPDTIQNCCDCALDCKRSHSFGYYFKFVNAIIDAGVEASESASQEPSQPREDTCSFGDPGSPIPDEPRYQKPPTDRTLPGAKPSTSKEESIVRTAIANRSMLFSDAEVAILVQMFCHQMFWCPILNKLAPLHCHPNHKGRISMFHELLSAIQRGDFLLGSARPEEFSEFHRQNASFQHGSSRMREPKRSHPRSQRSHTRHSQHWFKSPLNDAPEPGIPPLPPKWAFLLKYWDNLELSDDIGAGVGLSYELLPYWQMKEPLEIEDKQLLVIGWAEFSFFTASQIPTLKPNSIDQQESRYREGCLPMIRQPDLVLGPAPYANRLGFFFNEMWLPEHYEALACAGYYPLWIHQEFCFYAQGEQDWHFLEPRFGIRTVPKTPIVKWIWSLEEMGHLAVIVDLDCPDFFLNLVQVSDGSYSVAGRKCRSLSNSYVNYWNFVIDGTVLYQGMKAAHLNEQQMMSAHCTNEAVTFLRSWITNSRIIRGLQAVLEHDDITGTYAHTGDLYGHDLPRPFPDCDPFPDRNKRRQNYYDAYQPFKKKLDDLLSENEPPSDFNDIFDNAGEIFEEPFFTAQRRPPKPHIGPDSDWEPYEKPAHVDFYFQKESEEVDGIWDQVAKMDCSNFLDQWHLSEVPFPELPSMPEFHSFELPPIEPLREQFVGALVPRSIFSYPSLSEDEERSAFEIPTINWASMQVRWDDLRVQFSTMRGPQIGLPVDFANDGRAVLEWCACELAKGREVGDLARQILVDGSSKMAENFKRCVETTESFLEKHTPALVAWILAGCALLASVQNLDEVSYKAHLLQERVHIADYRTIDEEWNLSSVRNFCGFGSRYREGIGPSNETGFFEISCPVISQMDTTVVIDGKTYSIYEPAPYDPKRLRVKTYFDRLKFPAVRPECIYWVYAVDLYVPSPHAGPWTTVYRCGKTPPKYDEKAVCKFQEFAVESLHVMASEMAVEWRCPSMEGLTREIFRETMENMAAKQADLRMEDFEDVFLGRKKADSHHARAFTKLDENPGGRKPRHIFSATHWAFQNLQNGFFDVKKCLKKIKKVNYDGREIDMPHPFHFSVGGFQLFVTYMADTDQVQDACWMYHAMQAAPGEIHIAVGGDDNTSVANIDGVIYQIEGDIRMCDQSMHEIFCKLFIQFMSMLGASPEFLDVLAETYQMPCIFFYKHDIHTPAEVMMTIMFRVWMLFTGQPQTSIHNTVILGLAVSWALVAWARTFAGKYADDCDNATAVLKMLFEKLGFSMKLHIFKGDQIMATFHKKYFLRHENGSVTTSFLPGASLPRILRVRSTTPIKSDVFWERIRSGARSRLPVVAHPRLRAWLAGLAGQHDTLFGVWDPGELIYKGVSSLDVGADYAHRSADLHEDFWCVRYGIDHMQCKILLTVLESLEVGKFYDARACPDFNEIVNKMWSVDNE